MTSVHDYVERNEQLDEQLAKWREDIPGIGPSIRHPLVFAVPYFEQMNAFYNDQLKLKTKLVEKAEAKGELPLWLYERPYRIQYLYERRLIVPDKKYWKLLREIWIDSENIWQHFDIIKEMMTANRPFKKLLMNRLERKTIDDWLAADATIEVYRGHQQCNPMGMSWTTDIEVARRFAKRWLRKKERPTVTRALVRAKHIIALFLSRSESEIVVDPDHLTNIVKLPEVK